MASSSTTGKLIVLLLCSCTVVVAKSLRGIRIKNRTGLSHRRRVEGAYRNVCTGSYSNDVRVTTIADCEDYLASGAFDVSIAGDSGGAGGMGGSMTSTSTAGNGSDNVDDETSGIYSGSSSGLSNTAYIDVGGPEDKDCSITSPQNPGAEQKVFPVEYWYAVETSEEGTTWLEDLEDKVYRVAIQRMSWCIGEDNFRVRRSLQMLETADMQHARELGIVSVTSSPDDRERTDVSCPGDLSALDATNCYVVQGKMNIRARVADDLSHTIAAIQSAVGSSMENDELLDEDIPSVVKVSYLGTSKEEVNPIVVIPPTRSVSPTPSDDDDDSNVPVVVGVATASLLVLLVLLFWQKKRKVVTQRNFAALGDEEGFNPLPGTGDPAGSFHYGLYHYFADGKTYLSTNCRDCHETRLKSNSDYGGVLRPAGNENFKKLIAANSKDLGAAHSAMNVHKCTSSTCKLCRPTTQVQMVPIEQND